MPVRSKLTLLSIDGGGIRGVVPLYLLDQLEKELRVRLNDPKFFISRCFNVLSGTSTGAIITAGLSVPDASGVSPQYDANYIMRAYLSAGQKIFRASTWESFKSLGGLTNAKYSSVALEKYFEFFFKKHSMSDLLYDNMIVAYDLEKRKPFLFTGGKSFENSRFQVKDALKASTSAPIYFSPSTIRDHHGDAFTLVDGGVVANSSTLVLLKYLLENKHIDSSTELTWISLGTGYTKKSVSSAELAGAFSWLYPLLDILNTGSANNVSDQTAVILASLFSKAHFVRISPALVNASDELDDISPSNLEALQKSGKHYIKEHTEEWESLIQLLMKSYSENHA